MDNTKLLTTSKSVQYTQEEYWFHTAVCVLYIQMTGMVELYCTCFLAMKCSFM